MPGVRFGAHEDGNRDRWRRQKEEVLKKVKQMKGCTGRLRLEDGYLSLRLSQILMFTLVRPILEYASFIWWQGEWKEGEMAVGGILKSALQVRKQARDMCIYRDFGMMEMETRRDVLLLRWPQRVAIMHPSMLTRQVWMGSLERGRVAGWREEKVGGGRRGR